MRGFLVQICSYLVRVTCYPDTRGSNDMTSSASRSQLVAGEAKHLEDSVGSIFKVFSQAYSRAVTLYMLTTHYASHLCIM
jgi:hypothetical protein